MICQARSVRDLLCNVGKVNVVTSSGHILSLWHLLSKQLAQTVLLDFVLCFVFTREGEVSLGACQGYQAIWITDRFSLHAEIELSNRCLSSSTFTITALAYRCWIRLPPELVFLCHCKLQCQAGKLPSCVNPSELYFKLQHVAEFSSIGRGLASSYMRVHCSTFLCTSSELELASFYSFCLLRRQVLGKYQRTCAFSTAFSLHSRWPSLQSYNLFGNVYLYLETDIYVFIIRQRLQVPYHKLRRRHTAERNRPHMGTVTWLWSSLLLCGINSKCMNLWLLSGKGFVASLQQIMDMLNTVRLYKIVGLHRDCKAFRLVVVHIHRLYSETIPYFIARHKDQALPFESTASCLHVASGDNKFHRMSQACDMLIK